MKALGLILVILVVCSVLAEAVPAYGSTNHNNWNEAQVQQQQPARKNNQAGKKTLEGMVRQHIDDLDKQTQSDLKVLSYLEKELNKIFSCYIKLSCPRMRSSKVLAECDEIKDWPLYHQVMKMAGIRRYPYQNYAPAPPRHPETTVAPTEEAAPALNSYRRRDGRREREMTNNGNIEGADDTGATDDEIENDHYYQAATRRQPNNRRIRRDHHHNH